MSLIATVDTMPPPRRGWAIALPGAMLAFVLALHACAGEPALLRRERKLALIRQMQGQLELSVEEEKSAVLATTEDEAKAFAEESRRAAGQLEATRATLRELMEKDSQPAQLDALRELDDAWAELKAVDQKLLPMVEASTNRKATKLSTGHAAEQLAQLVGALEAIEAASEKPAQLRELSKAKAAALTIQTLHAPHIASAVDAEMTEMEGRMRAFATLVDGVLAGLEKDCPAKAKEQLPVARSEWTAYQADTAKIVELSRANSNVHAFDLSVHDKRRTTKRVEAALAALASSLGQDASKAAR